MSAREDILTAIRANRPQVDALAKVTPPRTSPSPDQLVARFESGLLRMGGSLVAIDESVEASLARITALHTPTCSVVEEARSDIELTPSTTPNDLDLVDLAVVGATLGVAETGSVLLTDSDLRVNALAYLAQHLVVLLDPSDIVPTLHEAYDHRAFHECAYACFHSGPSATADIEGVLIRGAQGVRSLRVMLAPRLSARVGSNAGLGVE